MRSVVHNFVESFTSRHSDFYGYWLFGFVVAELAQTRLPLMALPSLPVTTAIEAMANLAAAKFQYQLTKADLQSSSVRGAWLHILRLPGEEVREVDGHQRVGSRLEFTVEAVMSNGKRVMETAVIFVAPHDPRVERRSSRAA
jgi:hypothetical protein